MEDTVFRKILLAVVGIGLLATIIHVAYDINAYQHSSIIYFISKELW